MARMTCMNELQPK